MENKLAQHEPESIGQHEFIDTTAKWGRDFVEVLNPLEENAILRFYHEPPRQPEPTIDGWPLYSVLPQPDEALMKRVMDGIPDMPIKGKDEPIAYINVETRNLSWAKPTRWETPTVVKMDKVPLYTTPPKKEWVGLTDDEILKISGEMVAYSYVRFAKDIEAKLKEKNGG
jgi:hypothetical protein